MNIRLMTIDDYQIVYENWANTKGLGMRVIDDSYEGIKKFLEYNVDTCFVATNDSTIIGVILAGYDGRRGYLYHMLVDDKYRHQGIGKKLVNQAINGLLNKGATGVCLVAKMDNLLASSFWQNLGFKKRDDLVYFSKMINENNI